MATGKCTTWCGRPDQKSSMAAPMSCETCFLVSLMPTKPLENWCKWFIRKIYSFFFLWCNWIFSRLSASLLPLKKRCFASQKVIFMKVQVTGRSSTSSWGHWRRLNNGCFGSQQHVFSPERYTKIAPFRNGDTWDAIDLDLFIRWFLVFSHYCI